MLLFQASVLAIKALSEYSSRVKVTGEVSLTVRASQTPDAILATTLGGSKERQASKNLVSNLTSTNHMRLESSPMVD